MVFYELFCFFVILCTYCAFLDCFVLSVWFFDGFIEILYYGTLHYITSPYITLHHIKSLHYDTSRVIFTAFLLQKIKILVQNIRFLILYLFSFYGLIFHKMTQKPVQVNYSGGREFFVPFSCFV